MKKEGEPSREPNSVVIPIDHVLVRSFIVLVGKPRG